MNQIKELVSFGNYEPVVSVERETSAIPIPEKVFDDMRNCHAAVIHLAAEQQLISSDGEKKAALDENVLIEIGAAIALYNKRLILLVEKGVALPSNLQGLYCCMYDGDKLDGDATIKLLKAFNSFKTI